MSRRHYPTYESDETHTSDGAFGFPTCKLRSSFARTRLLMKKLIQVIDKADEPEITADEVEGLHAACL
jgi:hypothetical protein